MTTPTPDILFSPTYRIPLTGNPDQSISNYDSGDTITEVIANIRHLPYEVAVLFDQYQRKVYEYTDYCEDSCRLHLTDDLLEQAHFFIHNHPNSNWDFSVKDLIAATQLKCSTLIVACKNYTFVINNWPRQWLLNAPSSIRRAEDFKDFIRSYRDTDNLIYDLIDLFQANNLNTTYYAYNLRGELEFSLPYQHFNTITSSTFRQFYRAISHLDYARR